MDHILPYLFLLACPVSMGVMMWMMMRSNHNHASGSVDSPVAELESEVNELRIALHEQRTLALAPPVVSAPTTTKD